MRKYFAIIVVLLMFLGVSGKAQAVLIVETGLPAHNFGGLSLTSEQWLAGEIVLGQAYTVNRIEGLISDATAIGSNP